MASGDSLGQWDALGQRPRQGASTPPAYYIFTNDNVLLFDTAVDNDTCFLGVLPAFYSGGDIVLKLYWVTDDNGTPGGFVKWTVAFERRVIDTYEFDSGPMFGTPTSATVAATADFILKETSLTIFAADAGSPAAGDAFRISFKRDTSVGSNYDSNAYFVSLEIAEG